MEQLSLISAFRLFQVVVALVASFVIFIGTFTYIYQRVTSIVRPLRLGEKRLLKWLFVLSLIPVLNWIIPVYVWVRAISDLIVSMVKTFGLVWHKLFGKPNRFERRE